MVRVDVVEGADQGKHYDFELGSKCLIGRDSTKCNLTLSDKEVSRVHALIETDDQGNILISDQNSINGVYIQSVRITSKVPVLLNDIITIGNSVLQITEQAEAQLAHNLQIDKDMFAAKVGSGFSVPAGSSLSIGRDPSNDVVLANPRVSRFHATIENRAGAFLMFDLNSTNGTYVNGVRVDNPVMVDQGAVIQVSGHRFFIDSDTLFNYDDSGDRFKLEVRHLGKTVMMPGGQQRVLLEDISFTVEPCEFVAILGGSGAGKSSLLKALMGSWPATSGEILLNGRNFYQEYGAYHSLLGYVPQDDIVHTELTVEEVLSFAARLRMPGDTSEEERNARVSEVLNSLDLNERRNSRVATLSGGQRKRVSISVELLTKPNLFFLDEPTSGLDPGLERVMMEMLRTLSRQGQTIFLVTHATFNIELCDKVIFLTEGGRLSFYGSPAEALHYFGSDNFADIYKTLASEYDPQWWGERFLQSKAAAKYLPNELYIAVPAGEPQVKKIKISPLKQWYILFERYITVIIHDRKTLALLGLQPLVIAIFLSIIFWHGAPVFGISNFDPADVTLSQEVFINNQAEVVLRNIANEEQRLKYMVNAAFMLVITAIWFGASNAAREIVKEDSIYKRERLINLMLAPYLLSKVAVLALVALLQTIILISISNISLGLPNLLQIMAAFFLVTMAGVMIGLTISAMAASANSANAAVPILLIPQFLLSGALVPMKELRPEFLQPIYYLAVSKWGFELCGGEIIEVNRRLAFYDAVPGLQGDFSGHWYILFGFMIIFYLATTIALLSKDRNLS